MSARTKIRVRILNEELTLSGQRPEDELRAAAAYVDELLKKLAGSTTAATPANLAILTAINLASELLELRRRVETLESTVTGGSQQMQDLRLRIETLESTVAHGSWQMVELLEKHLDGLVPP